MKAEDYDVKAARALRSARLLLESGDVEGACNRAYYAMFDAAHAALMRVETHINAAEIKTHHGLIGAFGKHLVKTGVVPPELGRSLNTVEDVRLRADYAGKQINSEEAGWAVAQAGEFVERLASMHLQKATLVNDPNAEFKLPRTTGQHVGPIVACTGAHCVQHLGRSSYVIHDITQPVTDKSITIGYVNGKAEITPPSRGASLGR